MSHRTPIAFIALLLGTVLVLGPGCARQTPQNDGSNPAASQEPHTIKLLNVSYDPTRELYTELNPVFAEHWKKTTGQTLDARHTHGGSGSQARAVIDGLDADVVTLALAPDINAIAEKAGLLAKDWQTRLPHNSSPYTSTIILLVRKGNPKAIHDWSDLTKPDVEIITPNPKTSGGARWNYLAAWGYALKRELGNLDKLKDPAAKDAVAKAQQKARQFVGTVFHHDKLPTLEPGARDATNTFVTRRRGDVLLAWENEALLQVKEIGTGKFEIIVPSVSILAEPPVAIVDKVVDRHGTRKVAQAYLEFLYSPTGQEIAAKHFYRPSLPEVAEKYATQFPKVELFTVDDVFGGWEKAQKEHFVNGGTFDDAYKGTPAK